MTQNDAANGTFDLFIIGGGINGCGIARDAAGRGLRVGLAEMDDLASATSSASTKLFHGGLRYLEYFEVRLVREALVEREVLLRAMPHISWPMRFVLPYHEDMRFDGDSPASRLLGWTMPWTRGQRPSWMIRSGLFMYDHLGGRKILPGTTAVDLTTDPVGAPLNEKFRKAYEYSDCWVEDSRLVVLNARDAEARGAQIMTRTKVTGARRERDSWAITLTDTETGATREVHAAMLVNAGGPWVKQVIEGVLDIDTRENVRLVRGSHIVTRKLFDHDKCYFFQGSDGRIVFAIPYETDFTLIGTTDKEHADPESKPVCTDEERDYLIALASSYFKEPIKQEDVVWSYSGVRPLYDDGAKSATAATRDYVLRVNTDGGAPLLNVFGGKITTYRKLAEAAMEKIAAHVPGGTGKWTANAPLPGGDFPVDGVEALIADLSAAFPFLDATTARRLVRAYGTESRQILGEAATVEDLGTDFGHGLSEREVAWLMDKEFARTADDVLWRRSKLGLRFSDDEAAALARWMSARRETAAAD
ncbi:glycerol-3-phosphate dehydrogenase [Tropicimonas aquimaris]|uniref:Glycerol-3-phosphate dehydrogenase n=1 Tax=Tropicimonas aquimaris TaxID=914152 RepID=A0ABW3IV90_9RHOB